MPPPSKREVRVAIHELFKEAERWESAADNMEDLKSAVSRLSLDSEDFSFADFVVRVSDDYNQVRRDFAKLSQDAVDTFESLSRNIKKAATAFAREDDQNAHEIENSHMWSSKE